MSERQRANQSARGERQRANQSARSERQRANQTARRTDTVAALLVVLGLVPLAVGCATSRAGRAEAGPTTLTTTEPAARLLLDEDFDGDTLDRDLWGTCHWWGPDGCTIATNEELQWYRPEQVTVADGALRLTAVADPITVDEGTFPFRSGMVSTGRSDDQPGSEPRFAFTYGRVEARIRVPAVVGAWSAVWLLPVTNHHLPEVDIVEVYGANPDTAQLTFHHAAGNRHGVNRAVADLSEGWHTVALDWSPGSLVWTIDDDEVFSVDSAEVPDEPMYLVVNLAVGGPVAGPAPAEGFPATLLVDRVRVWAP